MYIKLRGHNETLQWLQALSKEGKTDLLQLQRNYKKTKGRAKLPSVIRSLLGWMFAVWLAAMPEPPFKWPGKMKGPMRGRGIRSVPSLKLTVNNGSLGEGPSRMTRTMHAMPRAGTPGDGSNPIAFTSPTQGLTVDPDFPPPFVSK